MNEICRFHQLGMIPYERAWQLQDVLAGDVAAGTRAPTLLLLEHPHTYTFGRRGEAENLIWNEDELTSHGITVHWVDRGGDVTYHGPGQLVGYPILPLSPGGLIMNQGDEAAGSSGRLPQADYIGYLRKLELVLIGALKQFGIHGRQVEGQTGVWVNIENGGKDYAGMDTIAKIAAIGIKVDAKGVSRHGFALNVNPDMHYWDGIIGCGLENHHEVGLSQLLDPAPNMQHVIDAVISQFGEKLGYEMVESELTLTAQLSSVLYSSDDLQ